MSNGGGLDFFLSGGASNSDPDLSTGGVRSSVRLISNSVSWASSAMDGVTLLNGSLNEVGTGQLKWVPEEENFYWKPPGASSYDWATNIVHANTTNADVFSVQQAEGSGADVTIEIVEANLPLTETIRAVTVGHVSDKLFVPPTYEEVKEGRIVWRGIHVLNENNYYRWVRAEIDDAAEQGRTSLAWDTTDTDGVMGSSPPPVESLLHHQTFRIPNKQSRGLWLRQYCHGGIFPDDDYLVRILFLCNEDDSFDSGL